MTVPAFAESPSIIDNLAALRGQGRILVILVCNAPQGSSQEDLAATEAVWNAACDGRDLTLDVCFRPLSEAVDLLVVDAWRKGRRVPATEGVGAARAMAADMALGYMSDGIVVRGMIHCTDADATWTDQYLLDADGKQGVYVHGFGYAESANATLQQATDVYHAWLMHHVAELVKARSPYAYWSVGSTISIDAITLAQVRGFPRRAGGEDFHLLNKARKVAGVERGASQTVCLEPRISARAPLGTGVAVSRMIAEGSPEAAILFLREEPYARLRVLIDVIKTELPCCPESLANALRRRLASADVEQVLESLCTLRVETLFAHLASQNLRSRQIDVAWMTWFDALKTLRFLHQIRDAGFASRSFTEVAEVGEKPRDAAERWRLNSLEEVSLTRRLFSR